MPAKAKRLLAYMDNSWTWSTFWTQKVHLAIAAVAGVAWLRLSWEGTT